MKKLSVIIAGSSERTQQCAQALFNDSRFLVTAVITPLPKPIGRKQVLTPNPLHQWSKSQGIETTILIDKKINDSIQEQVTQLKRPDFLLVVDFGYIIPKWLLNIPIQAPINIHPSDLPKYRGSSPGQFVLLFGEKNSCVSIIRMDEVLDHGPILKKLCFDVEPHWTATEYYKYAFHLVANELTDILFEYSLHSGYLFKQPNQSPTPTARKLQRNDGYVPLETIRCILNKQKECLAIPFLSSLKIDTTLQSFFNMFRALTPWPGIWTTIQRDGKPCRVKILKITNKIGGINIDLIQIEGKKEQADTGPLFL